MSPDQSAPALHTSDLLDSTRHRRLFRPRTWLFLVLLLAWLGVFVYDFWVATGETFPFWDVRRLDWLFVAANLVLVCFVLIPAVQHWPRTRARLAELRHHRAAAVAVAFLAGCYLLALLGPTLLGNPDLHYPHQHQPPLFWAVPESSVQSCVGALVDGWCHGSLRYPLGSNDVGQGTLRLIIQAQRVAYLVALISAALIVPIAITVGVTAATVGGRIDHVLMRYVDIQQAVPAVLIYIILAFYYQESLFLLVIVFGLLNWGGTARVIRSDALAHTNAGYLKAAESAGAPTTQRIGRHLLPNLTPTIATAVTREIPMLILIQVALAFIDLNQPLLPSYGNLLGSGGLATLGQAGVLYWWPAIPALLTLALTVTCFSILGDTLRDSLDPRTHTNP